MIDYWERQAMEDGRPGATMTNKANFDAFPVGWAVPAVRNKANFVRSD